MFESALILSIVVGLIYLGGQINLSFMETDATDYWRSEGKKSTFGLIKNSIKYKYQKKGDWEGERKAERGRGAASLRTGLAVPGFPN